MESLTIMPKLLKAARTSAPFLYKGISMTWIVQVFAAVFSSSVLSGLIVVNKTKVGAEVPSFCELVNGAVSLLSALSMSDCALKWA